MKGLIDAFDVLDCASLGFYPSAIASTEVVRCLLGGLFAVA
jgi:hypothetical protein